MATDVNPKQRADRATAAPLPRSWLEGGMAIVDTNGIIVEANDALSNWLEKKTAELAGQSFPSLFDRLFPGISAVNDLLKDSAPAFGRTNLKLSSPADQPVQWFVLETARHDQTVFVRMDSILPPLAELEEAAWHEHLGSESARRELYLRLLRAETQLDRLLRRWPCVVFSQRPDLSIEFASPNIAELTGIAPAEWAGQPRQFWRLVHELDAPELERQLQRAAQTRTGVTNTFRIRHARTGRVAYVLEHRQPTVSPNGLLLGYEVVWLDVTRQTVAEKRLSTAAWKETLAVLTLGMAHDFRNIMAGILSLSEGFLAQIEKQHDFHEGLSLIKNSSLQASQLVQRMITLHLGRAGERSYVDLNELTRDLVELVGKILPRRIAVKTDLAEASVPVYTDLVELRQVIINLLLNAADAMPNGGTLTLRTRKFDTLPEPANVQGTLPRLPCVCMTIQDSGSGIKERHLKSIFNPFFTTKSKGSGLGLYNAVIAMEKNHGAISVESKEGEGSSFHVWLPEADFSESAREMAGKNAAPYSRKSILLAGQAGGLFDRTAEWLRSHNYLVVTSNEPDELPDLLESVDYQFAGLFALVEPDDTTVSTIINEVRSRKQRIKFILKFAGCSPDEVNSQWLADADLVLGNDAPETDVLAGLKKLFEQKS